MDWVVLACLTAGTMLAFLRGVGFSAPDQRPDFGWLAISLIVFAWLALPTFWRILAAH